MAPSKMRRLQFLLGENNRMLDPVFFEIMGPKGQSSGMEVVASSVSKFNAPTLKASVLITEVSIFKLTIVEQS